MTMIGLLSNPTKADVSPEGLLPQGHVANVACLRTLHKANLAPRRES
jgi:hypothetical protein